MVVGKSVKITLAKAAKKAYGQPPSPWQAEAIISAAEQHHQREMLFDHPRGSGKTREIAMMTYIAMRFNKVRLAFLITDRNDLEESLAAEVSSFLEKMGCECVERCASSKDVDEAIERLETNPAEQIVLSLTLQTFPHIKRQLSPELCQASMVLADEVHRSHADKSLTEELNRVLGGAVPLRLYTGTATNRCLRLFGNRIQRGGIDVLRPFHNVIQDFKIL
jgi:type I site-specific restriction-modification system R (restriction) subunit